MIGIIDCRLGNIGSLLNALAHLNAPARTVRELAELDDCEAIVLPGVGAFDAGMSALARSGFGDAVKAYAAAGRPVLGICLGLQLLCNSSEEGAQTGLRLIDGKVVNLATLGCRGKIPHVGFNTVQYAGGPSDFLSSMAGLDFYFVHSFVLPDVTPADGELALAFADYEGAKFVAALQWGNVFATQFHPEKSGEVGLLLLKKFLSCSKNG